MSLSFLTTALLGVSLLTNLTVEAIKTLLNKKDVEYSSNVLAVITSVMLACASSAIYLVLNNIAFTAEIAIEILILVYLSFLVSTVGYDKVIETISQFKNPTQKK